MTFNIVQYILPKDLFPLSQRLNTCNLVIQLINEKHEVVPFVVYDQTVIIFHLYTFLSCINDRTLKVNVFFDNYQKYISVYVISQILKVYIHTHTVPTRENYFLTRRDFSYRCKSGSYVDLEFNLVHSSCKSFS